MGAHRSEHDQAALAALRQAIELARGRHADQQRWALWTRRPIRVRTHGAALERLRRALVAETEDPEPAPPCDCGICRRYILRRSP